MDLIAGVDTLRTWYGVEHGRTTDDLLPASPGTLEGLVTTPSFPRSSGRQPGGPIQVLFPRYLCLLLRCLYVVFTWWPVDIDGVIYGVKVCDALYCDRLDRTAPRRSETTLDR